MCDAIKHDCVCLYTPIVAPSSGQAEAASFVRATQDECDSLHSIKASLFVLSLFMCPPHVLFSCIVARVFSRGHRRESKFQFAQFRIPGGHGWPGPTMPQAQDGPAQCRAARVGSDDDSDGPRGHLCASPTARSLGSGSTRQERSNFSSANKRINECSLDFLT